MERNISIIPEENNAHLNTNLSANQRWLICNGGPKVLTLTTILGNTYIGSMLYKAI